MNTCSLNERVVSFGYNSVTLERNADKLVASRQDSQVTIAPLTEPYLQRLGASLIAKRAMNMCVRYSGGLAVVEGVGDRGVKHDCRRCSEKWPETSPQA